MAIAPFYVFYTSAYRHLYDSLFTANSERTMGDQLTLFKGKLERKRFPDGEPYYRFGDNLYRKRVLIVGGTPNAVETQELLALAYGAVALGAEELNIVDAYFGFSTMERDVQDGEVITAKVQAQQKSAIPKATYGNWFFHFDLHTEGLPGYYEGGTHVVHLHCEKILAQAIQELGLKNFAFASTDLGRGSWIKSYAKKWDVPIGLIDKRRVQGDTTVETVIGAEQLKGRDIVLFDDMFRTCGSAKKAAEAYKQAGAKRIYLVGTHGIFANHSLRMLQETKLFSGIICTDTHPNAARLAKKDLKVVSVAPLLLDRLFARDNTREYQDR